MKHPKLSAAIVLAAMALAPALVLSAPRVPNGTITAVGLSDCSDGKGALIIGQNAGSIGISLQGPFTGVVRFTGSIDGVQFVPIYGTALAGSDKETGPANGSSTARTSSSSVFYAESLSSGSVVVTANRSQSPPGVWGPVP